MGISSFSLFDQQFVERTSRAPTTVLTTVRVALIPFLQQPNAQSELLRAVFASSMLLNEVLAFDWLVSSLRSHAN